MATPASGRSIEKLATLETTRTRDLARRGSASNSRSRSRHRRRARDDRGVEVLAELVELVEVLADDQRRVVGVPRDERLDDARSSSGAVDAQPVALLRLGDRVGHPLGVGQGDPDLDAVGRGDPALRLDVLPRRVVPLRADQGEHVALAAVLAHQRRGEAEPAAGLQVGGHPEDRRGQQVHLVVDDQAPVAGVEQLEVACRRPCACVVITW